MPTDPNAPHWAAMLARADAAARLAPLGGHPGDAPGRAARLWSRARSLAGLLLTARQKRFNLESAALTRQVIADAGRLSAEVVGLRADVAELRDLLDQAGRLAHIATVRADHAEQVYRTARADADALAKAMADERAALNARVAHLEQYVRALREVLREADDRDRRVVPFSQAG